MKTKELFKSPKATVSKLGVGWRPEMAQAISKRSDLEFVEVLSENFMNEARLPAALEELKERGLEIIAHCISLSPGSAKKPEPERVKRINRFAGKAGAALISDHICFTGAAGMDSGHLLPVPLCRESMKVMTENIMLIKRQLTLPFALENIASICNWKNQAYDEAEFIAELLEKTDSLLLLDLANLYANALNRQFSPLAYLKRLPLERLAYVHMAGGRLKGKYYHDTHADPIAQGVYSLLKVLCELHIPERVMLERDDRFPPEAELYEELDQIQWILQSSLRQKRAS